MDLRVQLTVVRRHIVLILQAMLVAAVVAGLIAHSHKSTYEATAQVLLLPGDPTESITPAAPPADISQYASLQGQLVTNPVIRVAVAKKLNSSDPNGLAQQVSVQGSNILTITASDPNARRAQEIANAYAQGYLDYSRDVIVSGLQRTATGLQKQVNVLQDQLKSSALSSDAKESVRAQFQAVYSQYTTATINLSLAGSNARLLAEATVPSKVAGTSAVQTVLFGAIAGLLLGLGAAFLREQLDDRIRSREDVSDASRDLSILAEVSADRRAVRLIEKGDLEAAMATQLGEDARAMRTAIMFLGVRRELRRILVTSGSPGDGKTIVSTMLAATFAQAGFRTVLISADLRRSGAEQLLTGGELDGAGLTDALLHSSDYAGNGSLASGTPAADYVWPTSVANLGFLPSGSLAPNPGELLGSRRMDNVLDNLSASYDILILDSASLLPVADSRTLVDKVDGVVLVASVGHSRRDIARTWETMGNANVNWLGLVLNRVSKARDNPYGRLRQPAVKV